MGKTATILIGAAGAVLLAGAALAQPPGQPAPTGAACVPSAEAGQAARRTAGGPPPAVAHEVHVTAIPGVVAEGAAWTKIWQQGGNSADGVLPSPDGGVLIAQEDYDAVLKVMPDGRSSVAVANAKGVGSLAMDRQGRLYGAHRTERPESTKPDRASVINAITQLAPERRVLADKWADGGAVLSVRPNDLAVDAAGGAYFTVGCLYYAGPKGASVVADDLRTNGIVFSPDDRTLYVTNGREVVAFDVAGPGRLANRRSFATLTGPGGGDGMAVDREGRLYVTSPSGVQVFDAAGKALGVIPTPRAVISVAFAGPDKKTLYVVGGGAEDAAGQPIREGPQATAATLYRLPMIAQGLAGRAK